MTWIRSLLLLIALACVGGAALFVGYTVGLQRGQASHAGAEADEPAPEATAAIKVAPARMAEMEKTVSAYGTVIASPEDVEAISVPFECRVLRVLAVGGQPIEETTRLIDVEPSPDALLALSEARSTAQAAEKDLAQVEQRLEMKLATKGEQSAADQALLLAKAKLASLEGRGIEARQLKAGIRGLVSKVDVQEGQIVPAGGPLVEVVPANRIQVKLGVEPAEALELKGGQKVYLRTVQGSTAIEAAGTLKMVTQRVNPASRLVDAYVSLSDGSPLMLETFVRARIVVASKQALTVPRSAVLPEDDKHILFTVHDGKAVAHKVEVGLETEDQVELLGEAVKPGDEVVIEGNAELEDGMAVEVGEEHEAASGPAEGRASSRPVKGFGPDGAEPSSQPAPRRSGY